jgi:hypothetical protein
MTLSGFTTANLTDTAGGNTFTMSGWTGSGMLANSGNTGDTVAASKNASFTLSDSVLTSTDRMSLNLSGFGTANLMATSHGRTFTITDWTGNGSLTGSDTGDTVVDSDSGSFTLTNNQLMTPSANFGLFNVTTANLTDTGLGGHSFTINGWTGNGTLTGPSDTLVDTVASNVALSNKSLAVTGLPILTLSGFTTANLTMSSSTGTSSWIDASGFSLGATNLTATGGGNVILYGGTAGNDTLTAAGTGDDVLIGNGAGDTLTDSGSGMNILIGGGGGDTLTANGSDILVSGATRYDSHTSANIAALDAVLAEWTSGDSYNTRINNIMSGVGPGNTVSLSANSITQDARANTLQDAKTQTQFGNWFLYWSDAKGKDTVKKNSAEMQNLL